LLCMWSVGIFSDVGRVCFWILNSFGLTEMHERTHLLEWKRNPILPRKTLHQISRIHQIVCILRLIPEMSRCISKITKFLTGSGLCSILNNFRSMNSCLRTFDCRVVRLFRSPLNNRNFFSF
jgi:hypothetical protein